MLTGYIHPNTTDAGGSREPVSRTYEGVGNFCIYLDSERFVRLCHGLPLRRVGGESAGFA